MNKQFFCCRNQPRMKLLHHPLPTVTGIVVDKMTSPCEFLSRITTSLPPPGFKRCLSHHSPHHADCERPDTMCRSCKRTLCRRPQYVLGLKVCGNGRARLGKVLGAGGSMHGYTPLAPQLGKSDLKWPYLLLSPRNWSVANDWASILDDGLKVD